MRIGFDAKRLFNNFTGLGNYSRFLVKALLDYYPEHRYTLYSPKIKHHNDTQEFRINPKLLIRTPPKWLKGSGFGSFWRSVNLGNIAFRDGMDIFHGLSNELPVTKPKGLKTVVTAHDLIFIRYPELYNTIDVKIYKKKLAHACRSSDKIIAISKQTAKDLYHYLDVPQDKVEVIYQGCHQSFKQEHSSEELELIRKKYQLPEFFVLTVGKLERRKNALLILQAMAQLKSNTSVVLVGKATSYQKQLDQFIESSGLRNRVHFIHQVEFADLSKIYKLAKVFVYPSRFEGFGIPIVEAIHSGVPVIAATGSCLEEAGGPASRYVNPDDPEELAKEIERMLGDEPFRNATVTKALDYAQKFEPNFIADNLLEVYKGVLS